jgi:hypothetical protein
MKVLIDIACSTIKAPLAAAMAWMALLGGGADGALVFPEIEGPAEPYLVREDCENAVRAVCFILPVHPVVSRDLMNGANRQNPRLRTPRESAGGMPTAATDGWRIPDAIETGMKADELQLGKAGELQFRLSAPP